MKIPGKDIEDNMLFNGTKISMKGDISYSLKKMIFFQAIYTINIEMKNMLSNQYAN